MRRALRVLVAVLSAYLIQAIILPDFKIAGVMLDVITITLYACGFSLGMYAGIAAGLLGAMILETVGGDLAGLTSVLCVTAGVWGAWVHRRLSAFSLVGNRRRERLIKRFTPMLAVGAFIVCKELLYLAYFYLTGVDIVFIHIFRVVFAGVLGAAASLALLPLWRFFLLRRAEDTLLARRIRRHREKKEGGQTSPETPDSRGKKFARAFRAGLREGFMAEPETAEAPDAPAPALEDEAREEAREDAAPSDAPEKGGTDA